MAAARPRTRTATLRPLLAVVIALGLVGGAIGLYVAARQTSLFALDRIEVAGAPPPVAATIRAALGEYQGRSLVRFDGKDARRRLASVSEVAYATFDRDFPHTLKVRVRLERPVAVLRRGGDAWVVSSSARVLQQLAHKPYPRLPRIWLPAATDVSVNTTLGGFAAQGVAAVAPLRPLHIGVDVRQVLTGDRELTLVLGTCTELRLGDSGDLRLKLSIAKQILPIANGARYLDVSVPERPVAGYKSQVVG
jgi:cell division septal protein FtsQ